MVFPTTPIIIAVNLNTTDGRRMYVATDSVKLVFATVFIELIERLQFVELTIIQPTLCA
jgi:hypothetical protein